MEVENTQASFVYSWQVSTYMCVLVYFHRQANLPTCSRLRNGPWNRSVLFYKYTVLMETQKTWQNPYETNIEICHFFCENTRRNRLFVDTTLWQKVGLWYNFLAIRESEFDELCDLRHIAASWAIYHHYHHHHYHLTSYESTSIVAEPFKNFPIFYGTEN